MKITPEHNERIAKMTFLSVYPHYITKTVSKGRTKDELHKVIKWLTGFDDKKLQELIGNKVKNILSNKILFAKPLFMKYKLLTVFSFCYLVGYTQNSRIDTIPFHFNKLLLVFKGTVNGVETDFAFDTGAAISVSNSTNNIQSDITISGGKHGIKDANQNVARIRNIKIDDLTVGNYHVNNIKAVTFDMPYLHCTNLFLLGQDVIKKFNWNIDFEKKLIYVSTSLFAVTNEMNAWQISYRSNRPFITFNINGTDYKNCLIDFGFTGTFDINTKVDAAFNVYESKQKQKKVNEYMTSIMGLTGLGKPTKTDNFIIDSMYFSNTLYRNIAASMSENTDTKIGIKFFTKFCKNVVLNYGTNTFYITSLNQPIKYEIALDARVSIKDGKFVITAKNINVNGTSNKLDIDEEIKSVNGKTILDFKSECDYLLWSYLYQEKELIIEKLNGEKIVIKRTNNLEN